jgi:hypothetical protein
LATVALMMAAIASCGTDDGDEAGAAEPAFEVAWDDAAWVASVSAATAAELAVVVDDGPMRAELTAGRAIDYACGQNAAGSCPTVTASCDAGQVSGAQLEYKATDGCTDKSGAPIQGTVVFTRGGVRDWTAELQALLRAGWTYDGVINLKTASGQPWSVTVTDLHISGAVEQSTDDSSCTKSCVKSTTLQANIDVTVSTPTPVSVDVSPVAETVTVNGSLEVSGTVTGHVTVIAKGPMGGDQTALDESIEAQLDAQSMAVTDVTYGIPPTCTCPAFGTGATASLADCGESTVTFSTPGGEACPTVSVAYATSSDLCDSTASLAARSIQETCRPIGL